MRFVGCLFPTKPMSGRTIDSALHLITNVVLSSVLLVSPFALAWTSQSKKTVEYPIVRRSVAVFSVPEITKADVEYLIRSTTDHPIYKLRCHHNGFEDINFDYSGDLSAG
jgi:hypothetical protein